MNFSDGGPCGREFCRLPSVDIEGGRHVNGRNSSPSHLAAFAWNPVRRYAIVGRYLHAANDCGFHLDGAAKRMALRQVRRKRVLDTGYAHLRGCISSLDHFSVQLRLRFVCAPLFAMGLAMGMFAAPNTASIMNSVPPEHRGAAAGMRSTLQNSGSTIGLSLLFTITLIALSTNLPHSVNAALLAGEHHNLLRFLITFHQPLRCL